MALYREWSSDAYSLAAIWRIEEPESFFEERTGLSSDIRNERRRLEYLTGRFLLRHLRHDFPLLHIAPDEHDKPRVKDNQYFFSISHSFPYVAAVVSPYRECGIDIQVWRKNMLQLQDKFLTPAEQLWFQNDPQLITLGWCGKEAAYKWQGRRGVEFKDHLVITNLTQLHEKHHMSIDLQLMHPHKLISVEAFIEADFACGYVLHEKS